MLACCIEWLVVGDTLQFLTRTQAYVVGVIFRRQAAFQIGARLRWLQPGNCHNDSGNDLTCITHNIGQFLFPVLAYGCTYSNAESSLRWTKWNMYVLIAEECSDWYSIWRRPEVTKRLRSIFTLATYNANLQPSRFTVAVQMTLPKWYVMSDIVWFYT